MLEQPNSNLREIIDTFLWCSEAVTLCWHMLLVAIRDTSRSVSPKCHVTALSSYLSPWSRVMCHQNVPALAATTSQHCPLCHCPRVWEARGWAMCGTEVALGCEATQCVPGPSSPCVTSPVSASVRSVRASATECHQPVHMWLSDSKCWEHSLDQAHYAVTWIQNLSE